MHNSTEDSVLRTGHDSALRFESSISKPAFGFLLSVLLLLGVTAITQVHFKTVHHGNEYTMLSERPFNFEHSNDLQLRILSPLAGYLLFMRGELFKYFMLLLLCVFFSAVYTYLRKKNFTVGESSALLAILVFSTLAFYQLYFPAYTDPGSFILIILLMMYHERRLVATIFLSLLLFNHESNVFLFPFFFLLMAGKDYSLKNLSRLFLLFIVAILPYYLYREFILSRVQIGYTLRYYTDPANMQWTREHVLPNLANGIFQAFRLAWLLPAVALFIDFKERRFGEAALILSAIVFVLLQFLIAYDISRLMGLAFPAILIGAFRIKEHFGGRILFSLTIIIFIINFFIPAYCVGALEPILYGPGWLFEIHSSKSALNPKQSPHPEGQCHLVKDFSIYLVACLFQLSDMRNGDIGVLNTSCKTPVP